MSFLDPQYEKPERGGAYFKLNQGDNIFRIVSPAVTGWEDWKEEGGKKTPVRTKERQEPLVAGKNPKHFWAFAIFDYKDTKIKIMQVNQASIQDAIYDLHINQSWGDPKNYDINIKKTGEGLETKYNVMPSPPSPLGQDIVELYSKTKLNLENIFVAGGNPFEEDTMNMTDRGYENTDGNNNVVQHPAEDQIDVSQIPM